MDSSCCVFDVGKLQACKVRYLLCLMTRKSVSLIPTEIQLLFYLLSIISGMNGATMGMWMLMTEKCPACKELSQDEVKWDLYGFHF